MVWRIDPNHPPALRQEHDISAHRFAIAPDLKTYATSIQLENGHVEVALWDMTTGAKLWSSAFNQPGEEGAHVRGLSFAAHGRILTAYGTGEPQLKRHWRRTLWDVTTAPRMIGSFAPLSTISLDGQWLSQPLDAGAKLVNLSSLEEDNLAVDDDLEPSEWGKYQTSCTFSPDSTLVAVSGLRSQGKESLLSKWLRARFDPFPAEASGHLVRLWDVASAREVMTLQCREAHFAPDGKVLATLHDTTINLWHLPPPQPFWKKLGWLVALGLIVVVVVCRFGAGRGRRGGDLRAYS